MTRSFKGAPNSQQFLLGRRRARHELTIDRLVQDGPRRREADRSCAQALLNNGRHSCYLCLGRLLIGRAAITHDIRPHCTMGNLCGHIDGAVQLLQSVQILGKRLPVPGHALCQRTPWDILDTLHQPNKPVLSIGRGRRKTHTTVTHYDRGNSMPRRGRHLLIPGCLAVIMGMDIDKTRNDYFS